MDPVPAIALCSTMVISTITDIDRRRIPNLLTGASGALAFAMSLAGLSIGPSEALSAAALTGLPLGVLAMLRPDGFGMGDAKLIGVMALFLGWGVWAPVLAGLGTATAFGIALWLVRPPTTGPVCLPLAPFLAVATVPFTVSAIPWLH